MLFLSPNTDTSQNSKSQLSQTDPYDAASHPADCTQNWTPTVINKRWSLVNVDSTWPCSPLTSIVNNTPTASFVFCTQYWSTCRGQIFKVQSFWRSSRGKYSYFGDKLEMCACKRTHNELSRTRLHNYTTMAAVPKFIAKNNKTIHQPVKQRGTLAT